MDSPMVDDRVADGTAPTSRAWPGRRGRLGAATCGLAVAVALMTGSAEALPSSGPGARGAPAATTMQGPPPVRLATGSVVMALHPYTSCWSSENGGLCYDGFPPHPLPSLGGKSTPITLTFAKAGWRFRVGVTDSSGHRTRVALVKTGTGRWRLVVKDLDSGRYTADIFGWGPQGDVAAALAFTLK